MNTLTILDDSRHFTSPWMFMVSSGSKVQWQCTIDCLIWRSSRIQEALR